MIERRWSCTSQISAFQCFLKVWKKSKTLKNCQNREGNFSMKKIWQFLIFRNCLKKNVIENIFFEVEKKKCLQFWCRKSIPFDWWHFQGDSSRPDWLDSGTVPVETDFWKNRLSVTFLCFFFKQTTEMGWHDESQWAAVIGWWLTKHVDFEADFWKGAVKKTRKPKNHIHQPLLSIENHWFSKGFLETGRATLIKVKKSSNVLWTNT